MTELTLTPVAATDRRPRRWGRLTAAVIGLLLLAAAVGVAATRRPAAEPGPTAPTGSGEAAPPVAQLVRPVRQAIRKTIEQPGRVEGYESTPVFSKIPGYVRTWRADIGDKVESGQVLAELSVPEEEEDLRRREAAVGLARAEVVSAERFQDAAAADVRRTEAVIRQAEAGKLRAGFNYARYKADHDRLLKLKDQGSISQGEFDATQDQYRSAEAALAEAAAAVESAAAGRVASEAARVRAGAEVGVASARLGVSQSESKRQAEIVRYARITAPFSGVVAARNVDTGHFVTPPTAAGSPTPLFVVVRTDPVRVSADVPETEAALVNAGQPATIRVPSLEAEYPGVVARLSWALDLGTRTLRVQIDLPNKGGELRPGMYATARFVVERAGAWVVPSSAVTTTDEQPYVVRVESGKGLRTPVQLGARQNGLVELVRKQVRAAPRGEPIPWESMTGTEELLLRRPPDWTDGMAVGR